MKVGIELDGDLKGFAEGVRLRIGKGARVAAERMGMRGKLRLRGDTLQGGLGQRVANSWRAQVYPKAANHTPAPAVQIWSNAPLLMRAFSDGTTIRAASATYLAIPTDNTPRRGRRKATPHEVEAIFGSKLIFKKGKGQQTFAFINAVAAKSGKGFRRATSVRTGQQNRKAELVLMFVMVRQVHLRKRLNFPRIFDELAREWPEVYGAEVAKAISAGSNQ